MALAQDAADVSGELSGSGSADRDEFVGADRTEEELLEAPPGDGALPKTEQQIESGAKVFIPHQSPLLDPTSADTSRSNLHHSTTKTQCLGVEEEAPNTNSTKDDLEEPNCEAATKSNADSKTTIITSDNADKHETKNIAGVAATDTAKTTAGIDSTNATKTNTSNICLDETKSTPSKPPSEPRKTALDKELEALLSLGLADPPPHDILMIQSEHNGIVDIVKADTTLENLTVTEGKGPPPPLRPATTWTSANLREFKHRMANEKHGLLTIRRGEVVTVRVPTHPEGKRLCWEFATDDYDIGFGIYFDWTPVTSTAVTLQVSESSDDEEEEETESPWHSREGDVERGSVYRLRSRYGEIMQVFRRDSHREVQAGSHEYPGEGVYLLKLDNSYSLLRNKTLYFHVYYCS
ncbi:hypothetical protein GDO81_015565 [Engystomops pustulosus]|uniref:GOLD domain-containing protein n=1 Tax=Engystomops pustulosus TaxID=76066 RepID=A0AAV7AS23_ENGPU|nr:hypothetical protein GDO81_015565 [Engystomops pustulosus]